MDPRALLCNICPKRPTFSDVSHLLTHLSSKAHLSNYFKLQIRSHQEAEASQLLDNYDRWYKANNLPKLLSDRMAAKESRKRYHGRSGSQFTAPTTEHATLANVLDPRLSDPFLSVEDGSGQALQVRDAVDYPSPPSLWKREDNFEPEPGSFLHAIPTWNGRLRNRARASRRHRVLAPQPPLEYDPFVEDDGEESIQQPEEVDQERAEFTKLKGILWPGMDIFDAATDQMKRKRNQKKDGSVVKTMEKTSQCVEPTELVFSPTGILRRQRVISGEVEDSSPLRGESPLPKRIPRPKRVLSQVDPNIHLGHSHSHGRKRVRKSSARHSPRLPFRKVYNLRSPRVTRPAISKPLPLRCDDRCSSLEVEEDDDDDDDFDLTMRGLDPKPRSGFSIFCDEQEAPTSSNHTTNLTRISTPVLEKESLEPFLEHERVESLFSLGSPVLKRRYASDAAYPPRAFLHDSPRFGLDVFEDLPALSRLDVQNQIYSGDVSMEQDISPNATISALDEDDAFERFCLTGLGPFP